MKKLYEVLINNGEDIFDNLEIYVLIASSSSKEANERAKIISKERFPLNPNVSFLVLEIEEIDGCKVILE
ncbi:hypothetical protein OKW24_005693 [Peribacillus simplex]|uniref:hypothetical protein n=1 Tax=Peribacillus simplex TaxID=1478 RepID=UPI0024E20850|nr:hypothetical protein [Peribacillus simplex]MDF9763797.1 hypothetical protein [Peribacillus simplex]